MATKRNYEIATTAQWNSADVSPRRLRQGVVNGEFIALRRNVYARADAYNQSAPSRQHAFHVRAALHDTAWIASHTSAATLHEIDLLDQPPMDVVSPTRSPSARGSRSSRNGVKVHVAELPAEHVTSVYGVPVTTPARTIIDLARALPFMNGVVAADCALHAQKASREDLNSTATTCAGWPGATQAEHVLRFTDARAESVLESCARVIFAEHALPPPDLQVEIFGDGFIGRVDFLWPQYDTIAEADGLKKYERTPHLAIAQLERDDLLREAGYKVVHFTWHQLFRETLRVIARIKTAFSRTTAD
jgi:hypothetical protein